MVDDTIIEPCVALDAALSIETPSSPNTPELFDASRPAEFRPPTAPAERVAEFSEPPAVDESVLDVFRTLPVAAPAVPPAVDAAPPTRPPPLRAVPCTAPMPAPEAMASSAPALAAAADCAEAKA